MNATILQSQFDRLARNPGDARLLKQLAAEFGSAVVRSRPEALRHFRLAAASALRSVEVMKPETPGAVYTSGALAALLDAAGCAEESLYCVAEEDYIEAWCKYDEK